MGVGGGDSQAQSTILIHKHTQKQVCLKEYGNNPEAVIDHVLEDNLPPHLKQLDRSLPLRKGYSQPKASNVPLSGKGSSKVEPTANASGKGSTEQKTATGEAGLLETRESVFDNDEFDVFRRGGKVDLSNIHIGKK